MSEGFNTSDRNTVCLDKLNYGICTKGEDCLQCSNLNPKLENLNLNEVRLNVGAKDYFPKSKRTENNNQNLTNETSQNQTRNSLNEKILNFNLDAKEYVPKSVNTASNAQDEEEDAELEGEEFDMIVKDIIENEAIEEEFEDDEESDEDKWFPKYKDCECCKGFVYKCSGVACANMNLCYCKMKEECDEEDFN